MLSNVAVMTQQILDSDSPDAQVFKGSVGNGELKCLKSSS